VHQVLGKRLARLDLGGPLSASENANTEALKSVDDARRQGCFRPDHHQVDAVLPDSGGERLDVGGGNVQVARNRGGAGVARSGKDLGSPGTLRQLPDEGVLPGTVTNDQYLQGCPPVPGVLFNLTPCIPLSILGEGE